MRSAFFSTVDNAPLLRYNCLAKAVQKVFGYITVDKSKLSEGEQGLYQTFMCGVCLSAKKFFSNKSRIAVGYDINFFNVLFHSVLGLDVAVNKCRCIAHPVTKRTVLQTTDVTDKVAICNVLLTELDLLDDVNDGAPLKKRLAYKAFKKDYARAQKLLPVADKIFSDECLALAKLEKEYCTVIDKVAHPFATLSQKFSTVVLGENANEFVQTLCYNVGKWVYLADALDDVAKDIRRGNYNPFVSAYSLKKASDVTEHLDEISFELFTTLNRIAQSYNDLNLTKYKCLLDNVIYHSMRDKTTQILNSYRSKK